jgi:hypothetical protein
MTTDELFTNPAFDCLDYGRKKAFASLYESLKGKTPEQAVPIILGFMQTMPKGNPVTPQQRQAMLEVITGDMSEKEKKNVERILQMIM